MVGWGELRDLRQEVAYRWAVRSAGWFLIFIFELKNSCCAARKRVI